MDSSDRPLANIITLGVRDFAAQRDFYRRLGWPQAFDSDDFAAFELRGALLALFPVDKLAADGRTNPGCKRRPRAQWGACPGASPRSLDASRARRGAESRCPCSPQTINVGALIRAASPRRSCSGVAKLRHRARRNSRRGTRRSGISDKANLDDGNMWPTYFALKKLTATEEKKIAGLLKKAVS